MNHVLPTCCRKMCQKNFINLLPCAKRKLLTCCRCQKNFTNLLPPATDGHEAVFEYKKIARWTLSNEPPGAAPPDDRRCAVRSGYSKQTLYSEPHSICCRLYSFQDSACRSTVRVSSTGSRSSAAHRPIPVLMAAFRISLSPLSSLWYILREIPAFSAACCCE